MGRGHSPTLPTRVSGGLGASYAPSAGFGAEPVRPKLNFVQCECQRSHLLHWIFRVSNDYGASPFQPSHSLLCAPSFLSFLSPSMSFSNTKSQIDQFGTPGRSAIEKICHRKADYSGMLAMVHLVGSASLLYYLHFKAPTSKHFRHIMLRHSAIIFSHSETK